MELSVERVTKRKFHHNTHKLYSSIYIETAQKRLKLDDIQLNSSINSSSPKTSPESSKSISKNEYYNLCLKEN